MGTPSKKEKKINIIFVKCNLRSHFGMQLFTMKDKLNFEFCKLMLCYVIYDILQLMILI